jgi:amino acid permease
MKEKWKDFKDWFYYYNEIFVYIIVIVIVFVLSYWAYIIRFDTGAKKLEKKYLQPKVIVIDSCEYIKSGTKIIHKENCKYCTERKLIELYKK